jgi:pilus assembly protein CpaD
MEKSQKFIGGFPAALQTIGTVCLLSLVLGGCNPPPLGNLDYQSAHPLQVHERTFHINVAVTESSEGIVPNNMVALSQFISEFHRRARSNLFVLAAGQLTGTERARLIDNIELELAALGVSQHQIVSNTVSPDAAQNPNVIVMSFLGSAVKVPDCGEDWSGESGFNPANTPMKNYGCSYQRNIGLMVSDPQDLIKSGHRGSTLDSNTIQRVIRKYQLGEPPISERYNNRVFKNDD